MPCGLQKEKIFWVGSQNDSPVSDRQTAEKPNELKSFDVIYVLLSKNKQLIIDERVKETRIYNEKWVDESRSKYDHVSSWEILVEKKDIPKPRGVLHMLCVLSRISQVEPIYLQERFEFKVFFLLDWLPYKV